MKRFIGNTLQDASLQVYEKDSLTHPLLCILPAFSQNASRLLLPKRVWKCVSTIFFWRKVLYLEAVVHRCSVKKVFLEISQISQENTCARVSFLIKLQAWDIFIKKEILAQVCSCEICEISKNTLSYRTPLVAASVYYLLFTCSITIHLSKLSSCWK